MNQPAEADNLILSVIRGIVMESRGTAVNQTSARPSGHVYFIDDKLSSQPSLAFRLERLDYVLTRFESTQAFLFSSNELVSGVIVLGPGIDVNDGLELQKQLLTRINSFPIIFTATRASTRQVVSAMKAGAVDFLRAPVLLDDIDQAISAATKRIHRHVKPLLSIEACQARYDCLTPREQQVMNHVVNGLSNKHMASKLSLSARTVEVHRSNVMKKMQARSLPELVRMAGFCDHELDD